MEENQQRSRMEVDLRHRLKTVCNISLFELMDLLLANWTDKTEGKLYVKCVLK